MSVRFFKWFAVISSAILLVLSAAAVAAADPASDLAAAEEVEAAAQAKVSHAASEVEDAQEALKPVAKTADAADQVSNIAEAKVDEVEEELVAERARAASEIETADANYEDEKSSHATTTAIGIAIAAVAIAVSLAAFFFSRIGKWPFSRRLTQVLAGALGVTAIAGLALALIPSSPEPPSFSDSTKRLAAAAEGDPADPPSRQLIEAEAEAEPVAKKAHVLDRSRSRAEGVLADAEDNLEEAESGATRARGQVKLAADVVEQEEREAAKESEFREEATAIDYDQLIKNPYRYIGEKVVYTGQIFQIQEGGGSSFMLLSVTDEGYGFWTDEVWVSGFGEIESAEEDIVTVYGIVTGAEEYETAIGGSNYVPSIKAKYVDE